MFINMHSQLFFFVLFCFENDTVRSLVRWMSENKQNNKARKTEDSYEKTMGNVLSFWKWEEIEFIF